MRKYNGGTTGHRQGTDIHPTHENCIHLYIERTVCYTQKMKNIYLGADQELYNQT